MRGKGKRRWERQRGIGFDVLAAVTVVNRHSWSYELEVESERDFEVTEEAREGEWSSTVLTREAPQIRDHSGQPTG